MATESPGEQVTMIAYADNSTYQYHAVYGSNVSGVPRARICGAASNAVGILQNKDADAAGKPCTVMTTGISKCIYGAAVTAGTSLMTDSSGHLVTATSTNPVVGVAWKGGTTNDIGEVLLTNKGPCVGVTAGPATAGPIRMPLTMLMSAADEVVGIPLGAAGTLTDCYVYVEAADSLSGKAATLYIKNGSATVATSDMALTSATLTEGNVIAATPSGANAIFAATDTVRISSKTFTSDFTASTGVIWVYLVFTA